MQAMPAMHRRLVSCGLVDADNMQVTASDDTVWLHRVERDEQGTPIPGQIDGWLNLMWAPVRTCWFSAGLKLHDR
jgi:hypothetical protein